MRPGTTSLISSAVASDSGSAIDRAMNAIDGAEQHGGDAELAVSALRRPRLGPQERRPRAGERLAGPAGEEHPDREHDRDGDASGGVAHGTEDPVRLHGTRDQRPRPGSGMPG
jgi:hypothetical protein